MTNENNIQKKIDLQEMILKNAYTRAQVVKAMNRLTELNQEAKAIIAHTIK